MHQPDFLQVAHPLHTHTHTTINHQPQATCPQIYRLNITSNSERKQKKEDYQPSRGSAQTKGKTKRSRLLRTNLGDLDTPVEEELGADAVLVLPDVVQQAAVGHQLGDQLHGGGQADPQQATHVGAGHARHHVRFLRGARRK